MRTQQSGNRIGSGRSSFEEQRHRLVRPIHRPIRALVDVRDDHEAARNIRSGLINHAALDVRIGPTELAHERGDGDLLIADGRP